MGGFPEGWAPGEHYPDKWARRFAIDFVGGDLKRQRCADRRLCAPVETVAEVEFVARLHCLFRLPEADFSYRLYWSAQPPVSTPLARVLATRTGMGGFPEGWAPGEHYPDK
jgi:glucan biosynthesis protein